MFIKNYTSDNASDYASYDSLFLMGKDVFNVRQKICFNTMELDFVNPAVGKHQKYQKMYFLQWQSS